MKRSPWVVFGITAIANSVLAFDPVLSVSSGVLGYPVADSCHGWEFTVNEAITVTHLGLYDDNGDGMTSAYPIGVFRLSDSQLLTSGTINAGAADMLVDNFRYADTPDLALEIGETYVISFYSAGDGDGELSGSVQGLSVDPVITLSSLARWQVSTGGLVLPSNYTTDPQYSYRIGPNFLFTPIPEPTTFTLLSFGSLAVVMARRRR